MLPWYSAITRRLLKVLFLFIQTFFGLLNIKSCSYFVAILSIIVITVASDSVIIIYVVQHSINYLYMPGM